MYSLKKTMEAMEEGANEGEAENKEEGATEGGEEAQAGEKRPRPMSLFDISMDTPKRFRGRRHYEFDIDHYVSSDDDDEEIIEYKPDIPEIKYKLPATSELNYQAFMRAWCMTWARRKKAKSYLTNQEGRNEDGLVMEKLISQAIYQNDNAPLARPVVGFYCYMDSCIEGTSTKLVVSMECKEGQRDFNTFFQFIKMYLDKMMKKYYN